MDSDGDVIRVVTPDVLRGAHPRDSLDDWSRSNWDVLPTWQRRRCLRHLRLVIPAEVLGLMRLQHEAGQRIGSHLANFHFDYGMYVRNELRRVLPDEDLQPVQQEDRSYARNWDDYYMGALEALVEAPPADCDDEEGRWPSGWWILPGALGGLAIIGLVAWLVAFHI